MDVLDPEDCAHECEEDEDYIDGLEDGYMDAHGNDNTPEWGYCRVAGCSNEAIPCYDSGGPPDDPDDRLCADHCQEYGYCWGCGVLWAGNEVFDFSPRGLCGECTRQYCDDDDPVDGDLRWAFGPYSEFSERGNA